MFVAGLLAGGGVSTTGRVDELAGRLEGRVRAVGMWAASISEPGDEVEASMREAEQEARELAVIARDGQRARAELDAAGQLLYVISRASDHGNLDWDLEAAYQIYEQARRAALSLPSGPAEDKPNGGTHA